MGSAASAIFDDDETQERKAAEKKREAKQRKRMASVQGVISRPTDEQSIITVKQCWQRITQQVKESDTQGRNRHQKTAGSTDVIRIFVSSTFTDFNAERDILVKEV